MMAYVTLEDESGSIESLVFSNVINRSGSYLAADNPVVIKGRLSIREDRDPQIMCDDVIPLDGYLPGNAEIPPEKREDKNPYNGKRLYLKIEHEASVHTDKVRGIMSLHPGNMPAVLYFADSRKKLGACCSGRFPSNCRIRGCNWGGII